jgi:uncharacterized membrane protein
MTNLLLAALFLPASHFLVSSTSLRPVLIRAFGEQAYQTLYSLLAVGAFAWLITACVGAPNVEVWTPPVGLKIAAAAVDVAAMILIVAGLTTQNPVIVRSDRLFDDADVVRGILRVSRNSFFWGAGLLAAAHAASADNIAAMLAFGSVAFLGLAGGAIMDARKARAGGDRWRAFAAVTSNVPFTAILQGRQRLAWREIGIWRVATGVTLATVVWAFHLAMVRGALAEAGAKFLASL